MKIFVDMSGWVALLDRCDSHHAEVSDFYREFRSRGGIVYTSDYVDFVQGEDAALSPRPRRGFFVAILSPLLADSWPS